MNPSSPDASGATLIRLMPAVFVVIWATGFIVARYGMPYAPPFKFLSVRYALSILAFLVWIFAAGVRWPSDRRQWWHLCVTGVLMHGGYLGGVWAAVKAGMGSGLSALIVGLQPVLTAVWLSSRQGAEAVSRRQWLGLWLGFIGLALVVSRKFGHGAPGDLVSPLNLGFAVLALLSITAGTLYQKRHVTPCDVRTANAVQLIAALIVTLPLALLESESMQRNGELIGAMGWSVLGPSRTCSRWALVLAKKRLIRASSTTFCRKVPTTAVMAWLLFAEPITLTTLIGMGLTAFGVSLVVRQPKA